MLMDAADPTGAERAWRDVRALRWAASERAARPPKLAEDAWRGLAYDSYAARADEVAEELRACADALITAERTLLALVQGQVRHG